MKTKFSTFPHFLGNQTESQQAEPQKKKKTFSIIFSLLGFIVKKNENFIFFQFSHTFSVTKHNHTTKYNHKTYRKHQGQWSLRFALHFLHIGVEARISIPWSTCRIMGFRVKDKMSFDAEKKTGSRGNGKGEVGFHFSSYVLKSVVGLELFSNLRYFKNYFPL